MNALRERTHANVSEQQVYLSVSVFVYVYVLYLHVYTRRAQLKDVSERKFAWASIIRSCDPTSSRFVVMVMVKSGYMLACIGGCGVAFCGEQQLSVPLTY